MNKLLVLFLTILLSLKTQCWAMPLNFASEPLSSDLRSQLITSGIWKNDCPVKLGNLRLLTISYYDFSGKAHHNGQIILNKTVTPAALQAFAELYNKKFPINFPSTLAVYKSNWQQAENQNVTYGFICYRDSVGNYAQDSYGTTITINPVQNPEIDFSPGKHVALWCNLLSRFINCDKFFPPAKLAVLPSNGILSVNRSLQLKGMVDEGVASVFRNHGFIWGGDNLELISWKKFIFSQAGKINALSTDS